MFQLALFIIALLACLVSYLEKKKTNKISGEKNLFNLFTLLILMISAGVSYWSSLVSDKKNEQSELLRAFYERRADSMHIIIDSINRVNLEKSDTINKLLSMELDKSMSILKYSQKLNLTQNNFLKLQAEQTKNLIGDGSMPELFATLINTNTIQYFLTNNSNYPIQDISISISSQSNTSITNPEKSNNSTELTNYKNLDIGTLHRHAGYIFTNQFVPSNEPCNLYFVCVVKWRYGNYTTENKVAIINNVAQLYPTKYYYNNGKEFQFPNSILKAAGQKNIKN